MLPDTVEELIVSVPVLTTPPPLKVAVLADTVEELMASVEPRVL